MSDRLHLAIFLPSLAGGGAERAMVNLARGLAELGHRVDLVLAAASGPYLDECPPSVAIVDLHSRRVVTALPDLRRYLRRNRPHTLIAAMDHANVVAILARRLAGVPTAVIASLRDTPSVHMRHERSFVHTVLTMLARRLYPAADGLVAVSAGVADDASRYFRLDRQRIRVIGNPVITPDFPRLTAAPVDHPWLGGDPVPVVLACGRLVEQKDYPTLLRAFRELRRRRPARLIILGDGPDRSALWQYARELGVAEAFDMPGFRPNPLAYMARASVFALSSIREGSPNVLVQALAAGLPVVATRCPSGPDEILKNVSRGRLVNVGDHQAFAEALSSILADPPARSPLPLPRFDYLHAARNYLDVIQKVKIPVAQGYSVNAARRRVVHQG